MVQKHAFVIVAFVLSAVPLARAATLTPLSSFGNGDGWRAPGEVVTGDTAGTASGGSYNYLGTASLERGLAFNPVTGNLVVVSRSAAGNAIRLLSGTSGADVGSLSQGSGVISGGTFTTNMVGVGNDGAIYVNNLTTNASTTPHKVYRWAGEAASGPTVFANAAASAVRLGDTLDVTGSGASTRVVAGYGFPGTGYVVYSDTGALSNVNPIESVGPGDFRLGITFAQTANDVWGKQTGLDQLLQRTSYSGSAGTSNGNNALGRQFDALLDYTTIGGVPYLAVVDVQSSLVRVFDASDPADLTVVASLTTTSGTLAGNGNSVGSVKWGAVDDGALSATLYAMSTNQGIQAMTFAVPEPGTAALLAGGAAPLLLARRACRVDPGARPKRR